LRLFSFGGYGLALAALALMVFGAIGCPPFNNQSHNHKGLVSRASLHSRRKVLEEENHRPFESKIGPYCGKAGERRARGLRAFPQPAGAKLASKQDKRGSSYLNGAFYSHNPRNPNKRKLSRET